jgi:hypothetical protein
MVNNKNKNIQNEKIKYYCSLNSLESGLCLKEEKHETN